MLNKAEPLLFVISAATIRNDSAKTFDEASSSNWSSDPMYNSMFLRAQQQWSNDLLRVRGHLLLNDVYDALGFKRTKLGAVAGWTRDDTVDFGMVTRDNNTIDLNFNIRGIILDNIEF